MDNLSYSKGVSWFNDCRIPFVDEVNINKKLPVQQAGTIYGGGKGFYRTEEINEYKEGGRFPANILVSDDVLNDGLISGGGTYSGIKKRKRINHFIERGEQYGNSESPDNYGDKGTNSRYYNLDKWFDKLLND